VKVKRTKTQLEKCVRRAQLSLRKISKSDATRRQILRPKYTRFDFRCGSVPDPVGATYSASPDPPDVFMYLRGLLLRGREGKGRGREGRKREGKGREKRGKERGRDLRDQCQTASYAPVQKYIHVQVSVVGGTSRGVVCLSACRRREEAICILMAVRFGPVNGSRSDEALLIVSRLPQQLMRAAQTSDSRV